MHLFKLNTEIIYLFKTLKQNESQSLIKVCCIAEKLDDDVNEVMKNKKFFKNIINFNFLIKLISSDFFINSELSSQIAKAFLHN